MLLKLTIEIAAPLDAVWNKMVDWESQGSWMLATDVVVERKLKGWEPRSPHLLDSFQNENCLESWTQWK